MSNVFCISSRFSDDDFASSVSLNVTSLLTHSSRTLPLLSFGRRCTVCTAPSTFIDKSDDKSDKLVVGFLTDSYSQVVLCPGNLLLL